MSQPLSDNEIYQQLRVAIDDVDIDKITQIFNDHPDLDWNAITPNRLSALWWALTPPNGKPINHALISLLLSLKRGADPVINPTQLYVGFRPVEYIINYPNEEYQQTREEILQAEDIYTATWERVAPATDQLTADTHSASNPFIVKASDANLKRLYARYQTQLVIDKEIKDIDEFIASKKFPQIFPRTLQRDYICKALEEIKKDGTTRSGMEAKTDPCTLKEALALVWLAAKETRKNLVFDPDPLERQKAILKDLFEIRKANSCWLGRWGRIGTTLSNLHEDVYYRKNSLLTGELAKNKFSVLIGTAIADIHKIDKAKYYSIIRYRLGIGDEKDEEVAKKWWQAGLTPLKTLMVEANIAPNEIEKLISDTNAETISLSHHEPTRQLNLLLCFFQRMNKAKFFELVNNKNIEQTLELLKTSFINNCLLLPNDISKLNLPVEIINQIKLRIVNTLLDRKNEDEEIDITNLWEIIRTQIKIDELKNENLSAWYKALELNKQIAIAQDCQNSDSLLTGEVIKLALNHSCITGLSFKGMDLSGMDFRGWDLSLIDLSDTNLTGADLSLIEAEETIWKRCNLTKAKFNQFIFPEALLDSNQCTEEALKKQDTYGNTLLHWAILREKIPLIKAVLASPHCSSAVLKINNDIPLGNDGSTSKATPLSVLMAKTALSERASNAQEFRQLVDLFLASPHCTEEVLAIEENSKTPILHTIIRAGYFSLAQSIINSKSCTEKVFSMGSEYGTIIHALLHSLHFTMLPISTVVNFDIKAFAFQLINSPKCTETVFSTRRENRTPLQFAIRMHSPHAKAIETAQTRCFLKNLKEFLDKKDTTKEQILERFNELKDKNGKYSYIHVQLNPKWDKFRLLFKRAANGEKNFWHTEAYQAGVKMLKNAYLKKSGDVKDKAKEKAFIDYTRGNSPLHLLPTSTRRALK